MAIFALRTKRAFIQMKWLGKEDEDVKNRTFTVRDWVPVAPAKALAFTAKWPDLK